MFKKLFGFFVALFFGVSASSADLTGVAGFDGKGKGDGGAVTLSFSKVTGSSYTVTMNQVAAVFDVDPGLPGTEKLPNTNGDGDVWILKALPQGTMLYAVGLGNDWAGEGPDIESIRLAEAKASGTVADRSAKLQFAKGAGERCRVVTWVVTLPDGKRAWGANPVDGNPFLVKVGSKPATGWCFSGDNVVAMGAGTRTALTQKQ